METTEWTVLRQDEDREELFLLRGGTPVVRVKARTERGRAAVGAEMQLLAALEVDAVAAAPEVLEIEDDGYVREAGALVTRRKGRRSAPSTTPGVGERKVLARAREDLDTLITALHERGWVLGASPGEGLAMRGDGSVTVQDLGGLRKQSSAMAQVDDRLWVDSVLHDQDRTLRRRIDGPAAAPPVTSGMWARERANDLDRAGLPGRAGLEEQTADAGDGPEIPAAPPAPLPEPRALRRRDGAGSRSLVPGGASARRDLLATLGTVVLAGVLLGGVAWSMMPREGSTEPQPAVVTAPAAGGHAPAASSAPDSSPGDAADPPPGDAGAASALRAGPEIADPLALASELAEARHAYVTGTSDTAITAEGSSARLQDDAVREAYSDIVVTGGEPEVHSAHILSAAATDGTVHLSVETSTSAHTTVGPDGTTRQVPASGRATVHLELRWDGNAWSVEAASPA